MTNAEGMTKAERPIGMRDPRCAIGDSPASRILHRVSRITAAVVVAVRMVMLVFLAIAPISIFGAAKNRALPQLPGYKAVSVRYGPLNKMIMSVRINGQPANLLVDTGSNEIILDADAAESFGVQPSQRGPRYIGFTEISGHMAPVVFVQSLTSGGMNFGSSPAVLSNSNSSDTGKGHVDGVLGLQTLFRHKAVINCRTKFVFFKIDRARQTNLVTTALSAKFARVPLRREQTGALTVPCWIRGQSARLLVDTGAFVTTFSERFFKSLGIASEPTRVSAHFSGAATQQMNAGRINDLRIGGFQVPPGKFGAAALPRFALRQGNTTISGILGMDTLYKCNAIIDLDGMNLFLK